MTHQSSSWMVYEYVLGNASLAKKKQKKKTLQNRPQTFESDLKWSCLMLMSVHLLMTNFQEHIVNHIALLYPGRKWCIGVHWLCKLHTWAQMINYLTIITVYLLKDLLHRYRSLSIVEELSLPNEMNRLAVYSYMTRYPYGHTGSGRLTADDRTPFPGSDVGLLPARVR